MKEINIIGAGLAGCESAHYLLKKGYKINLYEQKPKNFSPAHHNPNFAELVCSNSFKSDERTTAAGILKNELRLLGSLCMQVADKVKVPSGSSLTVDRDLFSNEVTNALKKFPNLNIIVGEVECFDPNLPTILATGPLTSEKLSSYLTQLFGNEHLSFFDAIAPIVETESIDFSRAFYGNRYNKGETKDFINCPMNKEEYLQFYNALINAEIVQLKDFENSKVFEGCMPVEVLAKRGIDALRFGPLKPVGLFDPSTGKTAYAVVQLRKENLQSSSYNLVGFQTNLTYKAQKEVFSLIPALKNANFLRYGVMHKNTYINAPVVLNKHFQCKNYPNLFIAGQLSGVEGYIESMASGLVCAIEMDRLLNGQNLIDFTTNTIIGGLTHYLENAQISGFQPMGCNLGLLKPLDNPIKNKKEKNEVLFVRSQNTLKQILSQMF